MCGTNSGASLTKYLLFTFNFLFWLVGLFLLVIGVWAKVDGNFPKLIAQVSGENAEAAQEISTYVTYMSLFVIGLGAIVTIVALFGCCGAIRESRCCLAVFFTLLLVCFLLTLGLGGFILFVAATGNSSDDMSQVSKEAFLATIKFMWQSMSTPERENFEAANHCCGYDSTISFNNLACSIGNNPFTENCSEKLISLVQSRFFLAGGIVMAVAVIEVIGMTMSCVLYNRFAHYYTAV